MTPFERAARDLHFHDHPDERWQDADEKTQNAYFTRVALVFNGIMGMSEAMKVAYHHSIALPFSQPQVVWESVIGACVDEWGKEP